MKTKKVILIRHGDYNHDSGYHLSDNGKRQMERLAKNLLPEIEGKNITFISSMANRASESAEALQKAWKTSGLDISFTKQYEIWSGQDAYDEKRRLNGQGKDISTYNFDWLGNFIKESDHEIIIVVTHLEFVEDFPPRIISRYETAPGKGSAIVMDYETKESKLVNPGYS